MLNYIRSIAPWFIVSLFRLLKDNLQDSQFAARYQLLLAALLCCVGLGLREEFDRQCWLVSVLAQVAHKVRDASPSSRQVSSSRHRKHIIENINGHIGQ